MVRRLRHLASFALGLLPSVASGQTSVDDFRLGGSAFRLDDECIRLTPDRPYVSGSAWFDEPIDLSQPFEMRSSLVLGRKDGSGADGIVFVFHPVARTGFRGEGMGYAGLVPSIGVEFDTYPNVHLRDPAGDHVALMVDGQRRHDGDRRPIELGNLEDDARHPLRIRWEPQAERLTVVLDGEPIARFRIDLVESVFGGRAQVHWGMTAGTGRLSNAQDVCFEKLYLAQRSGWARSFSTGAVPDARPKVRGGEDERAGR